MKDPMLAWSKKYIIEAVYEEREVKESLLVEKEMQYRQMNGELQALAARLKDAEELAIKHQGRADSAEAALLRAHKALVTAVERLGGR